MVQEWATVSGDQHSFRILLIQPWTIDPEPIKRSLRLAGIDAAITRVDFKAALNAALANERFDATVFDSSTPSLSRETIEACFRLNGRQVRLVMLDDVTTLGTRLLAILESLKS